MRKQKVKAKKRSKTLHKAIACVVPANHVKVERAKAVLTHYQDAMTFFIHHMNQQLLMGEKIVSHTSLKPADLRSPLSARYVQEAYTQANATFTSYLGWLTRKVRGLITGSSLDDDTKTLFYRLNAQQKWYKKTVTLDWDITPDNELLVPIGKNPQNDNMRISKAVDSKDLWLLRRMVKKAKQWLNLPNLSRVTSINLSAQTMELQPSGNSFAFWLNLATLEKGKRVLLPLTRNSYLEQELRKGKLNKQVQVKFKENGTIAVSPIIEQETAELRTEGEDLGLDWGMVNLFTTSDGRRLGGKMLQKLRIYDKLLMQIQAELQQSNQSLKTNPEYQRLQSKIRNFVKNEIGRILNNLAKEDLKELVVEKLNFAGGGMSRNMNRLLTRAGRKALQSKLVRLNEEQGITTTEVQAAYTSQMCAYCGYTDRKNRQSQAKFKCQCCGHTCNADVNAAFNILQRRSLNISLSNRSDKRKTLKDRLLESHIKICPSGKHLSMVSL